MQSAEYLETKKIVKDLLTKDGTLALIKAQLARKVVDCLHDSPKTEIKHTPTDDKVYEITKELLKSYGLQNTLAVFEAEWGKAILSNPGIKIVNMINNEGKPIESKPIENITKASLAPTLRDKPVENIVQAKPLETVLAPVQPKPLETIAQAKSQDTASQQKPTEVTSVTKPKENAATNSALGISIQDSKELKEASFPTKKMDTSLLQSSQIPLAKVEKKHEIVNNPQNHLRDKSKDEGSIQDILPNGALTAGVGVGYPFEIQDHYHYFWVRDGGISMLQLAEFHNDLEVREQFKLFYEWTRRVQETDNGFGYTRFDLVNGKPDYNWMSPQYDGFAFRALAFIKYCSRTGINYDTVIKSDLDNILSVWNRNDGYEPWEEVVGEHYMVRLVHMEALLQGSLYFKDERYLETAILIKNSLKKFYNGQWIKSTLNGYCKENDKNEGARTKVAMDNFIDISTILGLNIVSESLRTNYQSLETFFELVNSFGYNQHVPPIQLSSWGLNNVTCSSDGYEMAPGIGRYPEDIFDGIGYMFEGQFKSFGAGFWFLATNAMAEFLYKLVNDYTHLETIIINKKNLKFWRFIGVEEIGEICKNDERFEKILDALFIKADSFLIRSKEYVIDGYMSEQFHYLTGSQMSTSDLSWSYASIISVNSARTKVLRDVEPKRCAAPQRPSCPLPCKNHCGFPKPQPRCVANSAEECHSLGCCWVQRDVLHPICLLSLDQPSRIGTIFEVEHHVEFGQTLSVVGTFNNWDTCSGLECNWTSRDIWKCPGFVGPEKYYEVKAIVYSDCHQVEWQKGENVNFNATGKPQLIKFKF
ncbi:hypothetical protein HDV06_004395 [Boothiomyces sp. JEL0866]|nr:hypothetical protein HDV06_004395 [Boothiomyces sp. JEL0866]